MEEILGLPVIELEASDPIREMEAASPTLMEIEVVEIALAVALLVLPMVMEEMQPIGLSMLALLWSHC